MLQQESQAFNHLLSFTECTFPEQIFFVRASPPTLFFDAVAPVVQASLEFTMLPRMAGNLHLLSTRIKNGIVL